MPLEQTKEEQRLNGRAGIRRRVAFWLLLAGCLVIAMLGFFPRDIVIAPRWKVEVVDTGRRPLSGIKVKQWWRHYGLETTMHYEWKVSDSQGIVLFDRRMIRTSA